MVVTSSKLNIRWEKLPDYFVLPDDPVDNISQPFIAAALGESLSLANRIANTALVTTNYGICATVNDKRPSPKHPIGPLYPISPHQGQILNGVIPLI